MDLALWTWNRPPKPAGGVLKLQNFRIKYERLYVPGKNTAGSYPNLAGIFARPIRWNLVEQQYDEMVMGTVALQRGRRQPKQF